MKEIKFRGISARTLKMIYWESKDVYEAQDFWGDVKDETVGQFIGLHDKNGEHEIYEGDKLEDEAGNIGVVEFDGGHFIIRHENGTSDFIAPKNKFKVIGNKYEN